MAAYKYKWLGEDQTFFPASLTSVVLVGNIVVMEEHTTVGNDLVADAHSDR